MTEQNHRYRASQKELEYAYESAKGRMECHPDVAEKYQNIIQKCSYFKSEKEALEKAFRIWKEKPYSCQIWAKVEKDDDIYRIPNYWIVTDDNKIIQAAEYIGMAQMYDETRLAYIIDDNIKIDDVIAYY